MPRSPRLDYPGALHHVTARCVGREHLLGDVTEKRRLLAALGRYKRRYGVQLHNYVVMDNHVHLLVSTPRDAPPGTPTRLDPPRTRLLDRQDRFAISRFMRDALRTFARGYNVRHDRTGHLWEARFFNRLVDPHDAAITVSLYLDLNAPRAGIPRADRGRILGGHAHLARGVPNELLDPLPAYEALGRTPVARAARYRRLHRIAIRRDALAFLSRMRERRVWGPSGFVRAVAVRFADVLRRGRRGLIPRAFGVPADTALEPAWSAWHRRGGSPSGVPP